MVQSDPVISKRALRIKSLLNNFNQKIPSGVEINNSQPNHGKKKCNSMYFVIYIETKVNKNVFWKVLGVSALAGNVTYFLFLPESLSWRKQEKGRQGKKLRCGGPEGELVSSWRSEVTNSSAGWGQAGPGCTWSGLLVHWVCHRAPEDPFSTVTGKAGQRNTSGRLTLGMSFAINLRTPPAGGEGTFSFDPATA